MAKVVKKVGKKDPEDVKKDLEKNVVVTKEAVAAAVGSGQVQEWAEPFPSEGLVRVMLTEDHGISEVTGDKGRMHHHKKGDVVVVSAALAQSLHRSITAAPEV